MEAVRILKALDLKPRRTIRIGLWSGEEQGLLGSRAYVAQHFGKSDDAMAAMFGSPEPSGEKKESTGDKAVTPEPKPEYVKFSAYFNLDNGTGKIRGVYLQGNEAVRPIFRKWLQPFREMGASTLTHLQHRRHRPPVVRRHRPARIPVHPGQDPLRHPDPPLQPGCLRQHPGRRHEAGRGDHGLVRLQHGDEGREAPRKPVPCAGRGTAAEPGVGVSLISFPEPGNRRGGASSPAVPSPRLGIATLQVGEETLDLPGAPLVQEREPQPEPHSRAS